MLKSMVSMGGMVVDNFFANKIQPAFFKDPQRGFSFMRSYELNPYVRYIFLKNGCFRTALFADVQYHFDHKTRADKKPIQEISGTTLGLGAYVSLSKSFRLELSSSWFLHEKRNRGEISMIYNIGGLKLNSKK